VKASLASNKGRKLMSPADDASSHRRTAPYGSGLVVGALIAATCLFSAGFNLAFFLMTHRDHRQGRHMSYLPRMEDFALTSLTSDSPNEGHPPSRGTVTEKLRTDHVSTKVVNETESGGGGGERMPPLLSCDKYGGPSNDVASEMVYWRDIPADAHFVSPFKREGEEKKYLTFEPDAGGWNNIRMALETVVALAHAMGRILVMPPKKGMYLLDKADAGHQNSLHFGDFFDLEALSAEHSGLEIISMEQFLQDQAIAGRLRDKTTGEVKYPPGNRTNWDGHVLNYKLDDVDKYLRSVAVTPDWNVDNCMVAFPSHPHNSKKLHQEFDNIMKRGLPTVMEMAKNPLPVNASTHDRMRELSLGRSLCIYDEDMQDTHLVHFRVDTQKNIRLLVHFYAFLFFEEWRHDLHLKRLVRDHLRYLDELQCAAARVVAAVRERARARDPKSNPNGVFDTMHIRRGDFQYKETRINSTELYAVSRAEVPEGATLYIATDERDRSFFKPFTAHYDVCFLGDFQHLFQGLSKNYYGMLDQLIASRGRTFFGTFYSTFTGYINRVRGYHADKNKLNGHEVGLVESYYFCPKGRKLAMKKYAPVTKQFWMREFPVAWRDIDRGVDL